VKITGRALLDLAGKFDLILDFDKEGICYHVNNDWTPEGLIDLISEYKDRVRVTWLEDIHEELRRYRR
jgi:hypothetical protein